MDLRPTEGGENSSGFPPQLSMGAQTSPCHPDRSAQRAAEGSAVLPRPPAPGGCWNMQPLVLKPMLTSNPSDFSAGELMGRWPTQRNKNVGWPMQAFCWLAWGTSQGCRECFSTECPLNTRNQRHPIFSAFETVLAYLTVRGPVIPGLRSFHTRKLKNNRAFICRPFQLLVRPIKSKNFKRMPAQSSRHQLAVSCHLCASSVSSRVNTK
jgi:hypothetical protein